MFIFGRTSYIGKKRMSSTSAFVERYQQQLKFIRLLRSMVWHRASLKFPQPTDSECCKELSGEKHSCLKLGEEHVVIVGW